MVTVFKRHSAELKFIINTSCAFEIATETGPQSSLTNFGSFAGKTSPDDNRNTSLHEDLSVKVFLQCWKNHHPYQTFFHLEQVWPKGTE